MLSGGGGQFERLEFCSCICKFGDQRPDEKKIARAVLAGERGILDRFGAIRTIHWPPANSSVWQSIAASDALERGEVFRIGGLTGPFTAFQARRCARELNGAVPPCI